MRRKQCEMIEQDHIDAILGSSTVGRLATCGENGYPYITPVNFVWYRDAVYFHCAPAGEKLDNIRRNPKVCFEVDIPLSYLGFACSGDDKPCKLTQLYHSVVIRGKAYVIDNGEEMAQVLNGLAASHEPDAVFTPVTADMPVLSMCVVVCIRPDHISAKSNLLQGKKKEHIDKVCSFLSERGSHLDRKTIEAIQAINSNKN